MKKHYTLILLPILILSLGLNRSNACTCGVMPKTLCESINDSGNQEVVLLKTLSFSFQPVNIYYYEEVTQAIVLEGLKNNALTGDTITVISGDDGACQGSLYEPGDTMLLVVYRSSGEDRYTYPSCGEFSAGYRNDTLFSTFSNEVSKLAYATFRTNFDDCIALKPRMNITGKITNWRYGNAISDLNFMINGADLTTDANGEFGFGLGYEGRDAEYKVWPTSNADLTRGINTLDVVMISRHILGTERFFRAEQYIAADVNNSQSITTLDLIYLRRVVLGIDTSFPSNNSWRFLKRGHSFPQTNNPWLEAIPEYGCAWILSTDFNNVYAEELELSIAHIYAIKVGDVDGSI